MRILAQHAACSAAECSGWSTASGRGTLGTSGRSCQSALLTWGLSSISNGNPKTFRFFRCCQDLISPFSARCTVSKIGLRELCQKSMDSDHSFLLLAVPSLARPYTHSPNENQTCGACSGCAWRCSSNRCMEHSACWVLLWLDTTSITDDKVYIAST